MTNVRVRRGVVAGLVVAVVAAGLWLVPIRATAARPKGDKTSPTAREARAARAKARKAKQKAKAKRPARPQVIKEIKKSMGTPQTLRLAIGDLGKTFGQKYNATKYLGLLDALEGRIRRGEDAKQTAAAFTTLQREALLANPLLDFDKILLVKRPLKSPLTAAGGALGLPTLNARVNDTIKNPGTGWDDTLEELSGLRTSRELRTVYKTDQRRLICDVDLHFDGERIMFSSGNAENQWGLYEFTEGDRQARLLTPPDVPDVSFYDSCYLPDGKIATTSTACYQGLPCQNGNQPMASLYLLDPKTKNLRQLTFEQDSDWCPTVMNDGRLLYLRWEYTDSPHYFTRVLFTCNPDGTGQMAYYGSNSYWPNAFFYARPIPDHRTRVIGIVGGHHGVPRAGKLVILDPARGRHEADGVVQEIPWRGRKVKAVKVDRLVDGYWPQFLHPYPLSGNYHLVSMKKNPDALWGVYLVDVFDNMVLLKEQNGAALLEPIPYRKTKTPPIVGGRVDLARKDATVYISNIYHGPGLAGVPVGTVKRLRVLAYHYAHVNSGGHASVGMESSWDVKRVLGTVGVEPDGSASFRIPANTPISLQPLDAKGQAMQLMRSWLVGMPGEAVSCNGCHEDPNSAPPRVTPLASKRPPTEIVPWYGPARPFSFRHEVLPVLQKHCAGCHNGEKRADGKRIPDLSGKIDMAATLDAKADRFHTKEYQRDVSYMAIQPFARRPGSESDYHMLEPMEYHASTSELIQMLDKGHNNVKLDAESRDRLVTWIDLNVPHRGSWRPPQWRGQAQATRRIELAKLYASVDTDPETEFAMIEAAAAKRPPVKPLAPRPLAPYSGPRPKIADWPMTADVAAARQRAAGKPAVTSITLGENIKLNFVQIPAGRFVMGSATGALDERPLHVTTIDKPFAICMAEISNAAYALFDPKHDSRYIDPPGKNLGGPGEPANRPRQPVVRVTWHEAMAFCKWLSAKTGKTVTLPTEAQWEWACRAGSDTPMWYGEAKTDFSGIANLADKALTGKVNPMPKSSFTDGVKYSADVVFGRPNAWGLVDTHGNVAEWTRSTYSPYPYSAADGRNAPTAKGRRVVRGGSWRDRPHRATSTYRLAYEPFQPVVNVGFRVIIED